MRFSIAPIAAVLALASVSHAQDAGCTALSNDYAPNSSGQYAKCYTEQVYNNALVSQGGSPDYKDIITQVCSKPACSHSTLQSATTKYVAACNSSMNAEAASGNILQIGKNALEIYFAEPIRNAYCAEDPTAPRPTPATPGGVVPPVYCLAQSISNPAQRFVSNLAIYLTSGSIRSSQAPFFLGNNLDPKEVCSECSQLAFNETVRYLSVNLMPAISPFYTPEFVQYWTKAVPAYNTFCKTSFVQTWPAGTLNQTVGNVPTGNPTNPTTSLPTATAPVTNSPTASPTGKPSGAGALKPVAGAAAALLMAAVALF